MSPDFTVLVPIAISHEALEIYLTNFKICIQRLALLDLNMQGKKKLMKDVLIIDYGSLPQYSQRIKNITKKANYRYTKQNAKHWSRAVCLNKGIKHAIGKRVFMIDADTFLPRDYIVKHLSMAKEQNYTLSYVYNVNTSDTKLKSTSTYTTLRKCSGRLRRTGRSHISVSLNWLRKFGGYDPAYIGWGGEDDFMIIKMQLNGLRQQEVASTPIHLWHPPYGELMSNIDVTHKRWFEQNKKANKARFHKFRRASKIK